MSLIAPVSGSARSVRRRATENALLDALEDVLVRDGIRNLTVNSVVETAGVGKPLLYRYFGDLPGLVSAWAERRGFTADHGGSVPAPTPNTEGTAAFFARIADELVASGEFLRSNPVTVEFLAEELTAQSELSAAFAKARRRRSNLFMRAMLADERYVQPKVRSRIVVLYAAVTYLAMRAQRSPSFMGIRLDTDQGWQEAMDMVRSLLDSGTDE
jgi:AcrR family transcriptional regulator